MKIENIHYQHVLGKLPCLLLLEESALCFVAINIYAAGRKFYTNEPV